ncbi:MAG: S8 family serine peptidase [Burkholderiales bacterium]
MRYTKLFLQTVLIAAACCHAATAQPIQALALNDFDGSDYTDRLIVKFRVDQTKSTPTKQRQELSSQLEDMSGVRLEFIRDMANGAMVMRLPRQMTVSEATAIANRLSANAVIDYAEADQLAFPTVIPNDPNYVLQWHLSDPLGGINAPNAWDISTGNTSVVVAVLDTGITTHPDLQARIVPGYDFVTDVVRANDNDARDDDPSDPGNWINSADKGITQFADCTVRNSNWHGTMVAGAIGAVAQNGVGVTGIDWNARILPVRVLGKCGGFTSDISDGMLWAGGLAVSSVPENANPAKVINMSLGSKGTCGTTYQRTIDQLVNAGKIVVVSAGNDNLEDSGSLSTCRGIVNVAATNRAGSKASYSNFGSKITIAAPGGESGDYVTTGNTGTTTPAQATYVGTSGTSFAAPTVTGVIALMLAIRPELDLAAVVNILQATARPFPDTTCTTVRCGAGIVDAAAALRLTRDQTIGTPSFLGFADADVGRPNQDIAVKVTNYDTGTSTLTAGINGGSDFSISSNFCAGLSLLRGASCTIQIRFNPTAAGTRTGTLTMPPARATLFWLCRAPRTQQVRWFSVAQARWVGRCILRVATTILSGTPTAAEIRLPKSRPRVRSPNTRCQRRRQVRLISPSALMEISGLLNSMPIALAASRHLASLPNFRFPLLQVSRVVLLQGRMATFGLPSLPGPRSVESPRLALSPNSRSPGHPQPRAALPPGRMAIYGSLILGRVSSGGSHPPGPSPALRFLGHP